MNRMLLLLGLMLCVFSTSCIPHKDIVYLQNKEAATDSTQVMIEQQKPYRVQINDILNVRVKALDQETVSILNPAGEENLNADSAERAYFDGFTVDVHGNIRIPTLGKVNVLGYTTEEIEQMIEAKLLEEQFKEAANIFVTVKLAGLSYTASGEVNNPGTRIIFKDRVNIFEAVANAGDIPLTGNKREVQIIRQYPQGQQIHTLDLTDRNVMNSPYYYIQPNDIIYVKPVKQKTWGVGTTGRETLQTIVSVLGIITTTVLLINR
ncbi:polysaccharide biosynthesis/export family protein [uncultured Psychroserpens sp.]|uniref:polysaccharide biosynthesis/export family protein n=1 Tax=uncultured Psychroserpens sp. TaxID=255436 RepID=UPI0026086014|nr:polysaccharide biosynthesis/export family protein [uncultured Psychroserpens sp.]